MGQKLRKAARDSQVTSLAQCPFKARTRHPGVDGGPPRQVFEYDCPHCKARGRTVQVFHKGGVPSRERAVVFSWAISVFYPCSLRDSALPHVYVTRFWFVFVVAGPPRALLAGLLGADAAGGLRLV